MLPLFNNELHSAYNAIITVSFALGALLGASFWGTSQVERGIVRPYKGLMKILLTDYKFKKHISIDIAQICYQIFLFGFLGMLFAILLSFIVFAGNTFNAPNYTDRFLSMLILCLIIPVMRINYEFLISIYTVVIEGAKHMKSINRQLSRDDLE